MKKTSDCSIHPYITTPSLMNTKINSMIVGDLVCRLVPYSFVQCSGRLLYSCTFMQENVLDNFVLLSGTLVYVCKPMQELVLNSFVQLCGTFSNVRLFLQLNIPNNFVQLLSSSMYIHTIMQLPVLNSPKNSCISIKGSNGTA